MDVGTQTHVLGDRTPKRASGGEEFRRFPRKSVRIDVLNEMDEQLRMSAAEVETRRWPPGATPLQLPGPMLQMFPHHGKLSLEHACQMKQSMLMAAADVESAKWHAKVECDVLRRRLNWHENVRDVVSGQVKYALGKEQVLPEWIRIEGQALAHLP